MTESKSAEVIALAMGSSLDWCVCLIVLMPRITLVHTVAREMSDIWWHIDGDSWPRTVPLSAPRREALWHRSVTRAAARAWTRRRRRRSPWRVGASSWEAPRSPRFFSSRASSPRRRGAARPRSPGADGKALRASLERLGYAPQDWEWLLSIDDAGAPLEAALLREAVCALDPATLVCCDEAAAALLREAYADDPRADRRAGGRRFFHRAWWRTSAGCASSTSAALPRRSRRGDARKKQLMWARLKKIPPLGEPF